MTQPITQVSLYEQDFALWVEDTVTRLKAKDFEHLDLENLIEEIESLGRSDKRELKSRLNVLLSHVLKRVYVDNADDNRGWETTIAEQRKQLKWLLEDSPSLKRYLEEIFSEIYRDALSDVRGTYRKTQFPEQWMFDHDIDTLLSATFWQD